MTRDEWMKAAEPAAMLDWLLQQGKLSDRKARLFAVACCRRVRPLLTDHGSWNAVEIAEAFSDRGVSEAELAGTFRGFAVELEAWEQAEAERHAERAKHAFCRGRTPLDKTWMARRLALRAALRTSAPGFLPIVQIVDFASGAMAWATAENDDTARILELDEERALLAAFLRDIVGDPLHATFLDTTLLIPEIVALATTIYGERSWDRLPDLADALAEASCTDATLLEHFRGPGPHTRGCFALDCVLGKS